MNFSDILFLDRVGGTFLKKGMKDVKTEKCWKILIHIKEEPKDSFFISNSKIGNGFIELRLKKRYWAADPFLFKKGEITYLFYELFDRFKARGGVAYSIIEGTYITEPKVIIREKYHLSFPYVFEYDSNIYMIPETCGNKTIQLFKAVNFPESWEKVQIIKADCDCVDSILIETIGKKRYLLTSLLNAGNPCNVSNVIYEIDKNFSALDEKILKTGRYGNRNAGKIIVDGNNNLFRVGQNCVDYYGQGLVFYRVVSVDPYIEQEIFSFDSQKFRECFGNIGYQVEGIHTYDFNDEYEATDLLIEEGVPIYIRLVAFAIKCYKFIIRRLRRYVFRCKNREYK